VSREDDAAIYEIAYAEAVRALSEQHELIESLRSRAGLILSVGAITSSFLGARALGPGGSSALTWLALVAFATGSSLCLAVLWPRARDGWDISRFSCSLRAPSSPPT
jgi:hypothetical protein